MFTATAFDKRPVIATIRSCRDALETYWECLADTVRGLPAFESDHVLNPLDAYLIHLMLDSGPKGVVVADMAAGESFGATAATALGHPAPQRILAWMNRVAEADQIAGALRQYALESAASPHLEFLASDDLPSNLVARRGLFVLADSRTADPATLAKAILRWQNSHPDSVILVLGIGSVGESEALDELLKICGAGSGRRLWLVRELADAVLGSQLAVIARTGLDLAESAIRRIVLTYTGNVRYLELLCDLNTSAIRKTDSDRTALRSHPSGSPVLAEIDSLKQQLEAAKLGLAEIDSLKERVQADHKELDRHRSVIEDWQSLARSEALSHRHYAEMYERMVKIANAHMALVDQREQELASIRGSFGYRVGLRFSRVRRWVAPDGSYRHRVLRKSRRGVQILRAKGLGALLKRIFQGPAKPEAPLPLT